MQICLSLLLRSRFSVCFPIHFCNFFCHAIPICPVSNSILDFHICLLLTTQHCASWCDIPALLGNAWAVYLFVPIVCTDCLYCLFVVLNICVSIMALSLWKVDNVSMCSPCWVLFVVFYIFLYLLLCLILCLFLCLFLLLFFFLFLYLFRRLVSLLLSLLIPLLIPLLMLNFLLMSLPILSLFLLLPLQRRTCKHGRSRDWKRSRKHTHANQALLPPLRHHLCR